jgi:hypothetical protein
MRDFDESTLWRVSEFERVRKASGSSGFVGLPETTVLPSTLLSDLQKLEYSPENNDVLEVLAACQRHREPALLLIRYDELLWPVTVFPQHQLYHSPRDLLLAEPAGLARVQLVECEPPGVRPPGHWMHERVGQATHYRPLAPMLWQMAMNGPRRTLLTEIGGHAAYRVSTPADERPGAPGAMGAAAERLRREAASLREIASWPGMTTERASRLLNALYLCESLMVTRTHPAARDETSLASRLFGARKPKR